MSIRNLDALFAPATIALIGASNRPGSVGAVLARNLLEAGFAGPILTVNPHARAIRSTLNYHSIAELPLAPDLAIIATPAESVPGLIRELGERPVSNTHLEVYKRRDRAGGGGGARGL
ncbi:CoA-binding protein [Chromohalobacter japonicus]|uniref:CoA-binding protein n=1 Tax=Chromohalobacter japonicus TaxID=223900 RepID=UPI00058AEC3A|nr:CoA-binding protein [Chromohalobacter japonicus]